MVFYALTHLLSRYQVDLVGGYYDAGDNVKYGLPMAFTITTLAWGALSYKAELHAAGELQNLHSAIKWGTDFFLKASAKRNRLWVQVSFHSLKIKQISFGNSFITLYAYIGHGIISAVVQVEST